jgi:GNAT superfamily N-acetyltransferase
MPIPEIHVQPIQSRSERKEFVLFPWKVYRGDPNWVPPLISDVMKMLDPHHHPFHEHAEVQCFLARRGGGGPGAGQVLGRIAAIVNRAHNEFQGERTGFFGFFDVLPDPRIPPFLLRAAADWLKERGMERMRGPANFSSNEEWGLLVDGFDRPPMVMMTYNPPAYAGYLEDFGLVKAKDLVAYYMEGDAPPERLTRLADRIEKSVNVRVRSLDKSRFREEVEKVREVYNSAWEKNWGFVPMTPAEIDHMAKELKPVFDPELILFAEVDGKPIGFAMALPDLNQALKKANGHLYPFGLVKMLLAARKIHALRVLTLGLVKEYRRKGIDTLMYLRLFQNGLKRGHRAGEFSWILEDNLPMRQALDNMGARVYKTYRLYDYPLNGSL